MYEGMKPQMPDVAHDQVEFMNLDWVGMNSIELPLTVLSQGEQLRVPALVRAQVSLDKKASRGIHMSRLYLEVQKMASEKLSGQLLRQTVEAFLTSHTDLSSNAILEVSFQLPLQRRALKSENSAWRNYPVKLSAMSQQGRVKLFMEVLVTYSSTCPASAALARQMIEKKFSQDFTEQLKKEEVQSWLLSTQGIVATPHAQRSEGRVKVEVLENFEFEKLINLIEEALQTPVQSAVKREDEQEFALRNGQNLMFCEDAARRVAAALGKDLSVLDFVAEFNHFESLHPHNAVSRVSKGLSLRSFEF